MLHFLCFFLNICMVRIRWDIFSIMCTTRLGLVLCEILKMKFLMYMLEMYYFQLLLGLKNEKYERCTLKRRKKRKKIQRKNWYRLNEKMPQRISLSRHWAHHFIHFLVFMYMISFWNMLVTQLSWLKIIIMIDSFSFSCAKTLNSGFDKYTHSYVITQGTKTACNYIKNFHENDNIEKIIRFQM